MRIVSGVWAGKELITLQGRNVTRPTTSRLRESIASMVKHEFDLDLARAYVLDAFAGSGALGFELMSQGAAYLASIEKDRNAFKILQTNAQNLGCQPNTFTALYGDCMNHTLIERIVHPINCVLLDPPYAYKPDEVCKLFDALSSTHMLDLHVLVVYEHEKHTSLEKSIRTHFATLELVREKTHGITQVSLFRVSAHNL